MYINPFWCGVLAAILFEVGAVIIFGVYENWKGKK